MLPSTLKKGNITLKSRTYVKSNAIVPPPDKYNITDFINTKGHYANSKFKNCNTLSFKGYSNKKQLKNSFLNDKFYENILKINNNGKYPISTIPNISTIKIRNTDKNSRDSYNNSIIISKK